MKRAFDSMNVAKDELAGHLASISAEEFALYGLTLLHTQLQRDLLFCKQNGCKMDAQPDESELGLSSQLEASISRADNELQYSLPTPALDKSSRSALLRSLNCFEAGLYLLLARAPVHVKPAENQASGHAPKLTTRLKTTSRHWGLTNYEASCRYVELVDRSIKEVTK